MDVAGKEGLGGKAINPWAGVKAGQGWGGGGCWLDSVGGARRRNRQCVCRPDSPARKRHLKSCAQIAAQIRLSFGLSSRLSFSRTLPL